MYIELTPFSIFTATDPRWVSINIGVFLCITCSGGHRSLGVHISKIRSVDLDLWEKDTVEVLSPYLVYTSSRLTAMQAIQKKGNKKANEMYECNIPADYICKKPKPDSVR